MKSILIFILFSLANCLNAWAECTDGESRCGADRSVQRCKVSTSNGSNHWVTEAENCKAPGTDFSHDLVQKGKPGCETNATQCGADGLVERCIVPMHNGPNHWITEQKSCQSSAIGGAETQVFCEARTDAGDIDIDAITKPFTVRGMKVGKYNVEDEKLDADFLEFLYRNVARVHYNSWTTSHGPYCHLVNVDGEDNYTDYKSKHPVKVIDWSPAGNGADRKH